MIEKTYQIRMRSAIGQQLETAWDEEKNRFVKETEYGKPSFKADPEKARKILAACKERMRQYKWMRLYVVEGA